MSIDAIDRFLAHGAGQPDNPAVCEADDTTSFGALLAKVRRLAFRFAHHPKPRVLIALPQGANAYAAMLAAGLCGGYYVPVNISAPIGKLVAIAVRTRPDVIVAADALRRTFCEACPGALLLTPEDADTGPQFEGRGTRHETAYIIFTSGSSGAPKGVVIPRHGLNHYVSWLGKTFSIGPDDRISQHPNIAFDLSVMDIYGALCFGAALYPVTDAADRMLPARHLQRHRITIWICVPTVVSLMMKDRGLDQRAFSSLRLVAFCGEPLLEIQLEWLFRLCPHAVVFNTYGPTEATVSMTALRLGAGTYKDMCENSAAIGEPIPGMTLYLIGGETDAAGEIVIAGPQLAMGYWDNREETEKRFKTLSIAGNEVRGYFTGDWAETKNGQIFFRERRDFQVKIRGFRLELDEVEAAIRSCGWRNVCALKLNGRLSAVVEAEEGRAFDEPELRRALALHLDAHAIPELFRTIKSLPRNENDKLDRLAVADWLASTTS